MKKLISMLLCAQLALCLMPAPGLAQGTTDEYVFTFRNGITWDSTLEEAMAAEGVPEGDAYTDGDISMFNVDDASFAGLSVDFFYLSMNGMLICIGCTPERDTDNEKALGDIKAALTGMYGQPNMTELSRVLNIVKMIGDIDEETDSIEASPWAGWVLPDERTLVFTSDINGSVGLLFLNEAPFAPKETAADAEGAALRIEEGDTVVFGSYEQDCDESNGREPMQWLVLDVQDGVASVDDRILLISQYALAYRPYHDAKEPVTWETSDLRAWLNGAFCSAAFTPAQRSHIVRTKISTPGNDDDYYLSGKNLQANVPGGSDTMDDVFVLSYEEAERYFYFGSNSEYTAMGYRLTAPTYAALRESYEIHGYPLEERLTKAEYDTLVKALPQLHVREGKWAIALPSLDDYAAFWKAERTLGNNAPALYWALRTPGHEETHCCYVCEDGSVSHSGGFMLDEHLVRPALWLNAAALLNADVASKAVSMQPDTQVDPALTGTWKGIASNERSVYCQFSEDGYHMVAVNDYAQADHAIFEANGGRLRLMQTGEQGDEYVMRYQVTADTLTLEADGETLDFMRVSNDLVSMPQKSLTIDPDSAAPAPASEEAPQPADRITARGFNTAEECAKAVAEALIAGDVQAFLDCYAIPEMARNFDHAAHIEAYRVTQLGWTLAQPSDDLAIAYNESYFVNDLLKRMISTNLVLKSNDKSVQEYASGMIIRVTKEQPPNELLEIANPGNALSRLVFQGTMTPDITNEQLLNNLKKQRARHQAIYGMTDITEIVVELELDSRAVYFPLTLVQYDGGWLAAPIVSAIGYLHGMPAYTLMMPTDMLEK
ncbi:MAG: DUF6273 domain-containing protein [Christensenellales bacterium]|jgi:hypothetical protein